MKDVYKELREPFNPKAISWRVGAKSKDKKTGIALAYISARDLMDRLDYVVGPENWKDSYVDQGKRLICTLSIKIDGEWVSKSDGAGDTAVEGEKGGISDAFKRAGVKWGVARYLYRLKNQWVPIKEAGRSHVLVNPPSLPPEALPNPRTSLIEHTKAARENWRSITAVKDGITDNTNESLSSAAEAYFEMKDDVKAALWLATRDGGLWTTDERKVIKEDLRSHLPGVK